MSRQDKRKEPDPEDEDIVEIMPLGAGQEVGRSCIIVKYMGKTIMMDAGIHPGFSGEASLPFLDTVDLDTVDVLLVTHFHLDHCAAVPYVVGRTNFKGRVFMTHPTKAIVGTLLKDFVKVSGGRSDGALYTEKDLEKTLDVTEVIDFHQTVEVAGIKVTAYRAGHVLGACMFEVEIAGMRLLYTGDYSRVPDRHLSAADTPDSPPHIVIVESTYGVSKHLPRDQREQRFIEKVRGILVRGGRVLLPVVALGRAQEVLLILEECWNNSPELQNVPIYQASGLARRAISVYQTYIEMMNDDIKAAFQASNPFMFKHVTHLKSSQHLDDIGPCVVMATPSMLQSGLSRELFEAWCEDPKNGVIIADFAVAGTLAREVLDEPKEVMSHSGHKLALRCSVDAISFSAHADFPQTSDFLDLVNPPHVVLVHGEAGEMMRLKRALEQRAKATDRVRNLYTPKVTQPVHIRHQPRHIAKVVGRLAEKRPATEQALQGLLVRHGAQDSLMHPSDLPHFTKLHPGRVLQRQLLALQKPFSEVRLALEVMFEGTKGDTDLGQVIARTPQEAGITQSLKVGNAVTVSYKAEEGPQPAHVVLEWEGGSTSDMVADAVIAIILQSAGEPSELQQLEAERQAVLNKGDLDSATKHEMQILAALLNSQFGQAHVDQQQDLVMLQVDQQHVIVDYKAGKVSCSDDALRSRVERAMQRLIEAMNPVAVDVQ
ncbi:hypothetical protein ABBQ38_000954 [Trebouxia sp. C0009 RCD-2024]